MTIHFDSIVRRSVRVEGRSLIVPVGGRKVAFGPESRFAIGGGPRTGKTSLSVRLANVLGHDAHMIFHTDDLVGVREWSESSQDVADWLEEESGACLVEGVAVVRALRKWLTTNPAGRPVDLLIWCGHPLVALSKGQAAMAKGCETILASCLTALEDRGVVVWRLS